VSEHRQSVNRWIGIVLSVAGLPVTAPDAVLHQLPVARDTMAVSS
jgi:hypothetical protein